MDNPPRNERHIYAKGASLGALPGFGKRVHLEATQMIPELHPTPGSSLQTRTSGVCFAVAAVRELLHGLYSN
jgi:hypothetical protein